ncbi:MAG: GTP-binding protein [Gammaproteobacteria bacterium]
MFPNRRRSHDHARVGGGEYRDGFLGSGKTTLLKSVLKDGLGGLKVAMIVNDFGAIDIDGGCCRALTWIAWCSSQEAGSAAQSSRFALDRRS